MRELVWDVYGQYVDKHGKSRLLLLDKSVKESLVCDRVAGYMADSQYRDCGYFVAKQGARRETLRFDR